MYATTSLRDAYRKFRGRDPNYLYAFGRGDTLSFVMGDADRVHALLPDVLVEEAAPGYAAITVPSAAFFPLVARLAALGQKVAMVARRVREDHTVSYEVSQTFAPKSSAGGC